MELVELVELVERKARPPASLVRLKQICVAAVARVGAGAAVERQLRRTVCLFVRFEAHLCCAWQKR